MPLADVWGGSFFSPKALAEQEPRRGRAGSRVKNNLPPRARCSPRGHGPEPHLLLPAHPAAPPWWLLGLGHCILWEHGVRAGKVVRFRVHHTTSRLTLPGSWLLSPVSVMVTSLPGTGGQGQVHPPRPKRGLVWLVGLGPLAPVTWCWSWRRCSLPDPLRASVLRLWEGTVGSPSRPTLCCPVTFCTWPCLIVGLPRDREHSQGCRATCRSWAVLSGWSCPPALPSPGEPGGAYTVSWRSTGCPVSTPSQALWN